MRVRIEEGAADARVPIPASVMAAASLRIGQAVDVRAEQGRVIIEPAMMPGYKLEQLLAGMLPHTFPEPVDFGAAVGGETF